MSGIEVVLSFFLEEFLFVLVIIMRILEVLICMFLLWNVFEVCFRVVWGDEGGLICGMNVINDWNCFGFIGLFVKLNLVEVFDLYKIK